MLQGHIWPLTFAQAQYGTTDLWCYCNCFQVWPDITKSVLTALVKCFI